MAHVRAALKPGGTCLAVEPQARDSRSDMLHPIGRLFYSAPTMVCVPASLSREVGAALGFRAGEQGLREVMTGAGSAT